MVKVFRKSIVARRLLLFITVLGMCMLIGDGILTPAISGNLLFAISIITYGKVTHENFLIFLAIFVQLGLQ